MNRFHQSLPHRSRMHRNEFGFAMVDCMIGMTLISLVLGCLFASNSHLLGLLKQGKESTYATQVIQERVEQLRTALWENVTNPANLALVAQSATASSDNLSGITETITVEPLVNPSNVRISCTRTPAGAVTTTGTTLADKTVKVLVSVRWNSGQRIRTREAVTIFTKDGI